MNRTNSTLQIQSRASLLLNYRDAPSYRLLAMCIVVLFCLTFILVWNWRRHKLSKDEKLGYVQSKIPFFTDTVLLLWGLGSGYGIIFAVKSPFYELFQIKKSVGIIFKGVGAILLGFTIGFIHVYYESENDYRTVRRSLSQMKRITYNITQTKIMKCNFKDIFLLFWSLSSGYGIIFAIESYIYELFGFKSTIAYIIKPAVATLVGVAIGCVHFYYDILQSRFMEKRTYTVVHDNKISDTDTDFDENEGDSNANDIEIINDVEEICEKEPTKSFSEDCVLERTATIDEFADAKDNSKWKLNRSKTFSNIFEKRSVRLNTM
eukprot:171624_1